MICLSFDEVFIICFLALLALILSIERINKEKKFKYDKFKKVNPEYLEHKIYEIKKNEDENPNKNLVIISLLILGYFAIKTIATFL